MTDPIPTNGQMLSDREILELMPQEFRNDLAEVCRLASKRGGTVNEASVFRNCLNYGALTHCRAAIAAALAAQPPAPAPASDGEREEMARLLIADAECVEAEQPDLTVMTNQQMRRAAALLRQPAPAPAAVPVPENADQAALMVLLGHQWLAHNAPERLRTPAPAAVPVAVAERPWEREDWCDEEGRCWWGRCADEFFNPEWTLATHADIEEFCSDAMPEICLPYWAIPIPQPRQGGEVES